MYIYVYILLRVKSITMCAVFRDTCVYIYVYILYKAKTNYKTTFCVQSFGIPLCIHMCTYYMRRKPITKQHSVCSLSEYTYVYICVHIVEGEI